MPEIRTRAEIEHALSQINESLEGAVSSNDYGACLSIGGIAACLKWVLGEGNDPGEFAEMLRALDQVDRQTARHKAN